MIGGSSILSYARSVSSFDPYGGVTEEEEAATGPYWLRHWRGQLSLARSYWVNGALVNIGLSIGQAMLLALAESRQLLLVSWAFIAFVALAIVLRIWSFVGIWRSAGRHAERGGSPAWGLVARGLIVVAVIAFAAQSPRLWQQVKEIALIATGNDPLGDPAKIEISRDGKSLTISGPIVSGVANDLNDRLASSPNVQTVVLNSNGGRIIEALAMADIIRARGLSTKVEENCESACTLIFLAGKERSASPLSAIGFHQPDFPAITESERQDMIRQARYDYRQAGIDAGFIDRIMAVPPQEMWYPKHDEMVDAGVINTIKTDAPSIGQSDRLNQLLRQAVVNINANKGKMLDEITRLDGASVEGADLTIAYTLTSPVSVSSAEFVRAMHPILHEQACKSVDSVLITGGARFRFDYRSSDGGKLGQIIIDRC